MLRDVVRFVQSRTDMTSRDDILREINYAWAEIWNSDDLPNSVFEISVSPADNTPRITLPYFVGFLRAVKANLGRIRVDLNTPRPYYQDETYNQSPYTWRILGKHPLSRTIENATRLKFTVAEAQTMQFTVTVIGTDDHGAEVRDQIVFAVGDLEKFSNKNFTDVSGISKDKFTTCNVNILGLYTDSADVDYGFIPNLEYEVWNTVIQVTDKCTQCCTNCRCFDVLYKRTPPLLYYDEQPVQFQEVLMQKTLEWITVPKEGQEKLAEFYANKGRALLTNYNHNDQAVEKKMDIGRNTFCSYTGSGSSKI